MPRSMVIRVALMATTALVIVGGLHVYLAWSLVLGPRLEGALAWVGLGLLAAGFLLLPVGLVAGRRERTPLNRRLVVASYVWMGAFELLVGFAVVLDLLSWGYSLVVGSSPAEALSLARWEAGLLLASLGVALPLGLRSARGPAKLERVRVPVKGLPEALRGVSIAFVSDLHVGDTLDRRWLSRLVERVNGLAPDLIAVGGDLIDGTVEEIRDEVAPLAGLRAPLGVYYVTGNHEYYHGGAAWQAEVARLGLTVLQNEHRVVERGGARLTVAGVTDLEGSHFHPSHACRPDLAFRGAPEGVPRILLAHQPKAARLAKEQKVDLQLSGHTHGGQMFPFMFFVKLQQPVVRGFHVIDGVPVYTGRGTGYWGPPIRLGAPPELTLVTLEPAEPRSSRA